MVAESVRRSSSAQNDERIVDAGMAVLVERGPDAFTLRDVAAHAGLSHAAVYARYDHRGELLADLWDRRCHAHFAAFATEAARGAGADTVPLPGWALATQPEVRAALELCIVAHRYGDLADIVSTDVEAVLVDAGVVDTDRCAHPLAIGHLALLVGVALVGAVRPEMHEQFRDVALVLRAGAIDWTGPAPEPIATPLDRVDPGASLTERLVVAAMTVVARSGVHGTTLKRLGRVASCAPTALYGAYASLEHLLLELIRDHAIDPDAPRRATRVVGNPHVAGAALLSGWVHPVSAARRRAMLEVYVAAAHDAAMSSIAADGMRSILDAQVAELAAGPDEQAAARAVLMMGDVMTVGVGLLVEVCEPGGIDLRTVDWRPFASSLSRGYVKRSGRRARS